MLRSIPNKTSRQELQCHLATDFSFKFVSLICPLRLDVGILKKSRILLTYTVLWLLCCFIFISYIHCSKITESGSD